MEKKFRQVIMINFVCIFIPTFFFTFLFEDPSSSDPESFSLILAFLILILYLLLFVSLWLLYKFKPLGKVIYLPTVLLMELTTIGFPIEMFILNEKTNYYKFKKFGPEANKIRILFMNLLLENFGENTIDILETFCKIGIGREIIGVFKK